MKSILIILMLLLSANATIGQPSLTFSIKQVWLPDGHISHYIFDGKRLIVKEKTRTSVQIKLKQHQINRLDSIITAIRLDTLENIYSRAVLDGVTRIFTFNLNGNKKEIALYNFYIENLDILLVHVNSLLKKKNRLISFGEGMLSMPDTAFYYLPDFYIDPVTIPEGYDAYRITCFKAGYFETDILDSIKLCDCQIYPTNNDYLLKRPYWRAFRLDNNIWRREYYNNKKEIFRTEYIQDVFPYEIIQEKIWTEPGKRPSVLIYRYFKTIIKN